MRWPFASWGADAVISGHDHTYERIFADGIVYFVNGLGGHSIYKFNTPVTGSQVRYNGDYGAMRVDASDTAITFEFISLSGNIIDAYTIETVTTGPNDEAAPQNDGRGGSGGGCSIRSDISVDSSWLFVVIGFGIGFLRRRLIKY
jgi:hypothetical protein